MPGDSPAFGMHTFGLEEMSWYPQSEPAGRRALEVERCDRCSVHAATHAMELRGRIDEGIAWLDSRRPTGGRLGGPARRGWGVYAGDDLRAAMAVAACGRALDARRAAMEATAQRDDNLARMARTVGKPPAQTAAACAVGRHAVVIDAIEAVSDDTRRSGGIHAPPDMVALTLIDSALRRQDTVRARRRLAERRVHESEASRSGTRLEACAGPAA